jgi:membrane fusion protein (multidrug efflux system)
LAAAEPLVVDSDLAQHPLVLQAEANVLDADLALQRTTIKAPETGYIVRRNVQVGQRVTPGTALLAIVPLNQIWVDANYKEQELRTCESASPYLSRQIFTEGQSNTRDM